MIISTNVILAWNFVLCKKGTKIGYLYVGVPHEGNKFVTTVYQKYN